MRVHCAFRFKVETPSGSHRGLVAVAEVDRPTYLNNTVPPLPHELEPTVKHNDAATQRSELNLDAAR